MKVNEYCRRLTSLRTVKKSKVPRIQKVPAITRSFEKVYFIVHDLKIILKPKIDFGPKIYGKKFNNKKIFITFRKKLVVINKSSQIIRRSVPFYGNNFRKYGIIQIKWLLKLSQLWFMALLYKKYFLFVNYKFDELLFRC